MRHALRAFLSLFVAFAAGITGCTQDSGFNAQRSAKRPWEAELFIPYERHVLANGLTLIIHEDHKAPVVAVNVWYHVGSKDERPGRTGFAHLFEHLMFNGSEHYDDEFFRPLEQAGATKMNGTTWLDRTNYFENVPTSALDRALWMESDRMGHLLGAISQRKLDEQRGVVQNEKRQGQNRPYGKVNELIAVSTYPAGHPYSWETIGSMEDLNAASLEDVKEWFRTYYGAANATLVVAGDVTTADVIKKVEHYFGDIPAGPVLKRHEAWIAKMTGEKRARLEDRVPQARLIKTWNIPGYKTRDYALLDLAAGILGRGKNSRLYKRLVYTDQTATQVKAEVWPLEIGSQIQLSVTVKPGGDVAAVEKALDEEIVHFFVHAPTPAELERIRTSQYADLARALERIDGDEGKASILAQNQVLAGSPEFYQQQLNWKRAATAGDIQRAAQAWLSDGVFVLTVEPTPEYKVASAGADRSQLPATGTPPELSLPPLERAILSNGLEVVLAERHNAPIVQLSFLIDAGFATDSLARPGTARLAFGMLDEGTKTRSALEIAERAELLGAQLEASSSLDTSTLGLNAITAKLPESLELFADILVNATFPQEELERQRAQTLAAIGQEKTQPRGIVARVLPRLVYGEGHAYAGALSGLGTEESVEALTRVDLEGFVRKWVRPDNARLLVVGDTTLKDIVPLLEQRLVAWRAPAEPLPLKKVATAKLPARPRVFLVNRAGAEQSQIVAGYAGPVRADPDYVALKTFNTVLGDGFISRINMNLREDKHWAYGAGSRLSETQGPGLFSVRAAVQTDKTAESMLEILKELRDITTKRKPTDTEIEFARNSLVLGLPGTNETVNEVATSYASILTFGLSDDYWNRFVTEVNSVTPTALEAAATKLIRPEGLTWLIVGDLAKIEDRVRALKLGDVSVIDADGNVIR